MIFYGSTFSPFVRKLVAFAEEKGLAFELKPIAINDPDPGFRAASPLRKMPAMADGDFTLADSSAIIHYLDAKYPEPALIPADPQARGRTIWFEEYADTVISAAVGKVFFNRIVAPRFMGRDGDEAVAAAALRDDVPKIFDYLESVVPEPGRFLVGDGLTLADIAIASPLANFAHCGTGIDTAAHPRLAAWSRTILERPSLAGSIAREARFLERAPA